MDVLKSQMTSRTEFERLVAADAGTLTDLERAALFLYLQRLASYGKVNGRSFGVDRPTCALRRHQARTLAPRATRRREDRVPTVRGPDPAVRRARAVFYLDPPYWIVSGLHLTVSH